MRTGRWMIAWTIAGWMVLQSGCASLDEHRKLELAHRTLQGEKARLEQELYESRSHLTSVQGRLDSSHGQLSDRDALTHNLRSENQRLQSAVQEAQGLVNTLANQNLSNDPIIIETKLPAALDTALKDFAARFPGSVDYDPTSGIVKWKSDLLFALGSDAIKDSARQSLESFAGIMGSPAASGFDVMIVGHTDNRPIVRAATKQLHPTNWHLSSHRAIAVSNVLRKTGVGSSRMGVMGYGEHRPIESNASEAGRAQNRRVEIYVVPEGSISTVPQPQLAADTSSRQRIVPMNDGVK